MHNLWRAWVNPETHAKFHLVMMVVWALLLIPSVTIWKDSIMWVVFMSWYALTIGHFSSYEATRAEIITKKQIEGEFDDMREDEDMEDLLERKHEGP